jgi:hypothetical protein
VRKTGGRTCVKEGAKKSEGERERREEERRRDDS